MSASQPIPVVTLADVERIARRDYGARADEVLALLAAYGEKDWEREVPRVRVAILRLGAGEIETLKTHLGYAKRDYRDVLLGAEYLGYGAVTLRSPSPTEEAATQAINADWADYKAWFERS